MAPCIERYLSVKPSPQPIDHTAHLLPAYGSPGESNGVFEAGGTVPVRFRRKDDDDAVAEDCERVRAWWASGFSRGHSAASPCG